MVSLLLTLNIFHTCLNVSIVNFEQVIVGWEKRMELTLVFYGQNFSTNVIHDEIKTHKRAALHPFLRNGILGKTTGQSNWPLLHQGFLALINEIQCLNALTMMCKSTYINTKYGIMEV